ncbi:peptidoglycan-binding domain-containing protein [Halomonas litopenaei]|uniref:peptidoglycan-binding domain-containing protein n=1 Tax=Halomonas litopenaei TaxID=2109328 RepID=UPI003FA0F3BA
MTMRRAGWLGVAGVAALYLMSIQSSLAAQRSVATMGQLRASIDEQGWCTDVVRVTVEVPAGAQLSEGSRELQLLTNGVRQILTLECPGLQAMEVTATSAGQVTGRWQHQGDGRLAPLAISASVPQATPSPARPPSPIQVAEIQSLLQALGYQPGPSDGVMGSRTRSAIGAFVVDQRLAMPAQASAELLVQLRLASCGDAAGCRSSGNQTLMNDASTKVALSGELGGGPSETSSLVGEQRPRESEHGVARSHDYGALVSRHGLSLHEGLPVLSAPRSAMSEAQTEAVPRFLDRVTLGGVPDLIQAAPDCWARLYLEGAARDALVDDDPTRIADGINGPWRGDNEFDRERSRAAFLEQHSDRLTSQAIGLPLEFVTIRTERLGPYDRELGGFRLHRSVKTSIDWVKNLHRLQGSGKHHCGLRALQVFPPAVDVADIWRVPPEEAEQFLQRVESRMLHVATTFRLSEMAHAQPSHPNLPYQQLPLRSELVSIRLYEDPELTRLAGELSASTAHAPIMLTGLPDKPRQPEPVLIDEDSLALLLLRDHGDVLSDDAWIAMARQHMEADRNYYSRTEVIDSFGRRNTRQRADFDPGYIPFFPNGFDSGRAHLSNEQMQLFQSWMALRADHLPETLSLRVGYRVGDDSLELSLPALRGSRDSDPLFKMLGERGISIHQAIRLERELYGMGDSLRTMVLQGPEASRYPVLVFPEVITSYIPELTEEKLEMMGDRGVMDIELTVDSAELVTIDENEEFFLVEAVPSKLLRYDANHEQRLNVHEYEAPSHGGGARDIAENIVVSVPGEPLHLSAEVMDLLIVRHLPDALNEEDYRSMLRARWAYENSIPISSEPPDWGRFFKPGMPPLDEQRLEQHIDAFKTWTLERAKALPDTFAIYDRHVITRNAGVIDILHTENLTFGPLDGNFVHSSVRSCENYANLKSALAPACQYLKDALQFAPRVYPFGLGYQPVGPRVECGMLNPEGHRASSVEYCKARRSEYQEVGYNQVEPGFRDILVFDKELHLDEALMSGSSTSAMVEFRVKNVDVRNEPLPVDFAESLLRVMDFQRGLGWNENNMFGANNTLTRRLQEASPDRNVVAAFPEHVSASRYFVLNVELAEAYLRNSRSDERATNLELREPRAIDVAGLDIPDLEALSSAPEEPYGQDMLGIRLGMSMDEAEAIIRDHMDVEHVLIRDRRQQPGYVAGEFQPFTSGQAFISKDRRERIILYDEPPAALGVVMGVTRQLAFPKGQVTLGVLLNEVRKKYGQEGWSDRSRARIGWGEGFESQNSRTGGSHTCFPRMSQMTSLAMREWQVADGLPSATPLDQPLSLPSIGMPREHPLGMECGVSLALDASASGNQQEDLFTLHLIDPNRYLRVHQRSQAMVKSGETGEVGQTSSGLEIKL